MNKTATLATAIILAIGTASALTVTPEQSDVDIMPGDQADVGFYINQSNSSIQVDGVNTPQYLDLQPDFLGNNFSQGETANFVLYADEQISEGNYTVNATFSNDNESTTESVTVSFQEQMYDLGTFNYSDGEWLRFVDEDFKIRLNQSNGTQFSLEDTCQNPSDTCSFEKNSEEYLLEADGNESVAVSSTLNQTIIQGYDLVDIEFSVNRSDLVRGETYGYETVNQRTGETVTNTRVKFNASSFEYDHRSSSTGKDTLAIPYDLNASEISYELINTQDAVDKQVLKMETGTLELKNYSEYVEERKLTLRNLPGTISIGDTISGEVNNGIQDYTDATVRAEYGDESSTIEIQDNGNFDFTLPADVEGNQSLDLTAVNTRSDNSNYSSQTLSLKIIGDSDGDSVINTEDECEDTPGLPELDGCPRIDTNAVLYEYDADSGVIGDEVDTWNLRPDTAYYLRVETSDGETVNGSVDVEVTDSTEDTRRSYSIEGGKDIFFEDPGGHTISFEGEDRYSGFDRQVLVKSSGGLPLVPMIFGVLLLGAGVFGVLAWKNKSVSGAVRYIQEMNPRNDEEGKSVNTSSED